MAYGLQVAIWLQPCSPYTSYSHARVLGMPVRPVHFAMRLRLQTDRNARNRGYEGVVARHVCAHAIGLVCWAEIVCAVVGVARTYGSHASVHV